MVSLRKTFLLRIASYLSHSIHIMSSNQICENTLLHREYCVQALSCFICMWRMWAHWKALPGNVIVILMSSAFICVQWPNGAYRNCLKICSALQQPLLRQVSVCSASDWFHKLCPVPFNPLIHLPFSGCCWLLATWPCGKLLKCLWGSDDARLNLLPSSTLPCTVNW